jgi:non-specific serine/threonine protein kinase
MLDATGRTILMDFGAGAMLGSSEGARAGTPLVMAPELFAQGAAPTVASDLYALGVLLYRLACGRYPVLARTRPALLRRLLKGGRVALRELRPDLPVALAEVIDRTLALDPAARPRDARQLEAAMRAASGGLLRAEAEPPVEAATTAEGAEDPGGRFIGRGNEIDSMGAALLRSRLVTLVGAGGAGKTRLAREAIGRLKGLFPDGVVWVPLAPLTQPEDVLREVAHRADVHESGATGLEQRLHEALADKESLVALDNCEHLLEACAETIGSLLEACPRVRVLATSRAPLGLQEEEPIRLRPMQTPPRAVAGGVDGTEIAVYESVRLFVDRVAQARPGFLLTRENAAAVAQICRRLDGLPLALELAAARARGLALEEIASRLEEGFRILDRSGGGPGSSHETLHASIEWSWSLLAEPAQVLLRRLSVFAGRWSLASAEAVAGGEGDPLCPPGDVPDLLDALVEHSLVVFEPATERHTAPGIPGGESPLSYRLLEPIREFAGRRLAASGEEDPVRSRHLRWAVDLAQRGDRSLYGKEQGLWVSLLEEMHDDFRAALRWAQRSAILAEEALGLALKLRRFWYVRGYYSEGRDHFLRLLAFDGPPRALRGRALAGCGSLVMMRGDHLEARRMCEESLALLSEDEDPAGRASALSILGVICTEMEEPAAARAYLEAALPLHREHGAKAAIPGVLNNLGVCAACMEDLDGAIGYYEEALSICRDLGDGAQAAIMANNLSGSYLERGNRERARAFADEAIDRAVAGRDRRTIRLALLARAEVAVAEGEASRARELAREALDYQTQEQDWPAAVSAAKVLLQILLGSSRAPEAAEILGMLRAHQDRKEERYYPGHRRQLAHAEAELRSALGDAAADAAFRRGALLRLEDLMSRLSGGPA